MDNWYRDYANRIDEAAEDNGYPHYPGFKKELQDVDYTVEQTTAVEIHKMNERIAQLKPALDFFIDHESRSFLLTDDEKVFLQAAARFIRNMAVPEALLKVEEDKRDAAIRSMYSKSRGKDDASE